MRRRLALLFWGIGLAGLLVLVTRTLIHGAISSTASLERTILAGTALAVALAPFLSGVLLQSSPPKRRLLLSAPILVVIAVVLLHLDQAHLRDFWQGLIAFALTLLSLVAVSAVVEEYGFRSTMFSRWMTCVGLVCIEFFAVGLLVLFYGAHPHSSAGISVYPGAFASLFGGVASIFVVLGTAALPLIMRVAPGADDLFRWTLKEVVEKRESTAADAGNVPPTPLMEAAPSPIKPSILASLVAVLCVLLLLGWYLIQGGLPNEPRVAFSPTSGRDTEAMVISAIAKATRQIRVAMYSLTRRPITVELIKAKQRGIDIEVILDRLMAANKYSNWKDLRNAGIPVHFWVKPSKNRSGFMHHKYAVFDGRQVLTGSFNWTGNAVGFNEENLVAIDSPAVADIYLKNWRAIPVNDEPPKEKTASYSEAAELE